MEMAALFSPHIAHPVATILNAKNLDNARAPVAVCPPVFFHTFHKAARLKFCVKQRNPVNPIHYMLSSSLFYLIRFQEKTCYEKVGVRR
jgi:hypothetical protein